MNWFRITKKAGLNNFNYTLPKDKSQLIYDFYMASFLYQDKTSYKDQFLGELVEETKNKVISQFREQLLDDVLFIIAAELRHFPDESSGYAEEAIEKAGNIKKDSNKEALRRYWKSYQGKEKEYEQKAREMFPASTIYSLNGLLPNQQQQLGIGRGRNVQYDMSYLALKDIAKTPKQTAQFVALAEKLFKADGIWRSAYGGPLWGEIAHSWLELYQAKTSNQAVVWIDHLIDLQHNSNTLFDKLISYRKPKAGYEWIKPVLDHKAHVVSPYEIMENCSPKMKQLASRALHDTLGSSWENNQKAIYDYWVNFLSNSPHNVNLIPEGALSTLPKELYFDKLMDSLKESPLPCNTLMEAGIITFNDARNIWTEFFIKYPSNIRDLDNNFQVGNLFTDQESSTTLLYKVLDSLYNSQTASIFATNVSQIYNCEHLVSIGSWTRSEAPKLFEKFASYPEVSFYELKMLGNYFLKALGHSKLEAFVNNLIEQDPSKVKEIETLFEQIEPSVFSEQFAKHLIGLALNENPLGPLSREKYTNYQDKPALREKIIDTVYNNKTVTGGDLVVSLNNCTSLFKDNELYQLRKQAVLRILKEKLESEYSSLKEQGLKGRYEFDEEVGYALDFIYSYMPNTDASNIRKEVSAIIWAEIHKQAQPQQQETKPNSSFAVAEFDERFIKVYEAIRASEPITPGQYEDLSKELSEVYNNISEAQKSKVKTALFYLIRNYLKGVNFNNKETLQSWINSMITAEPIASVYNSIGDYDKKSVYQLVESDILQANGMLKDKDTKEWAAVPQNPAEALNHFSMLETLVNQAEFISEKEFQHMSSVLGNCQSFISVNYNSDIENVIRGLIYKYVRWLINSNRIQKKEHIKSHVVGSAEFPPIANTLHRFQGGGIGIIGNLVFVLIKVWEELKENVPQQQQASQQVQPQVQQPQQVQPPTEQQQHAANSYFDIMKFN